jgi:hypothetical protein
MGLLPSPGLWVEIDRGCEITTAALCSETRKKETQIMNIIDAPTYEAMVIGGLMRHRGLSRSDASKLAWTRWPMSGDEVCYECFGRGLELEPVDLTDFLVQHFKTTHHDDGAPLVHDSIGWGPPLVEALLCWALEKKRGKPAESIPARPRPGTLAEMLKELRSSSPSRRMVAGFALARALGFGLALQGEKREDVEFISGPAISSLIGRAVAGDAEALEEIERHVTATRPPARTREQEQEAN